MRFKANMAAAGFVGAALLLPFHAYALSGTSNIDIDGGPFGALELSGGVDGYFYTQSTPSSGDKNNGANVDDFEIQLEKITGPIQFQFQVADYAAVTLGVGSPKQGNISHFTTGPVRAANITIPLTSDLSISGGQLGSLEGYESTFTWNNPTGVDTVLYYVTNSENRGVSATYTKGPGSVQVIFGDGNDTGVWNFLQFLGTYNFNANNNINVYGGIALGTTGPLTYYYGNDYVGDGNQPYVNANCFGGWYSWTQGNLNLVPEAQYLYSKPNHRYAASGFDQPGFTSTFGTALFVQYSFGTSPYSIGGWAEYNTSNGYGDFYIAPRTQMFGVSVGPAWQYKHIYLRPTVGFSHLLNTTAYGTGRNYVIAMLQGGLVF